MREMTVGIEALKYLSRRDKTLGAYIAQCGQLSYFVFDSVFQALVNCITDQQIAISAADAIKKRLADKFGGFTPQNFKHASIQDLTSCGLSARKSDYILGVIRLANDEKLDFAALNALSNEQIARSLLEIRGVGAWTVQMLLMFCFCRQDVTSFGDFGIRHGVKNLYALKELTEEKFNRLAKRWSPYGTAASLYLWQAAADKELESARKANFKKA